MRDVDFEAMTLVDQINCLILDSCNLCSLGKSDFNNSTLGKPWPQFFESRRTTKTTSLRIKALGQRLATAQIHRMAVPWEFEGLDGGKGLRQLLETESIRIVRDGRDGAPLVGSLFS